jgi:tetratricopeptide (TPR) repeat protein
MRPGDASAYRNRGIALEAQGDVQGAVADWRTASRLGDTEVLQWIAAATQPQTMAKTVGSVLGQVAPAAPVVAKSNKVLLAEANGLLAKGSPTQARDLYIKILQNDASDRKALFNLAVAFRKAGQYKEALIAYDKYIAVVPNDPAAFRNRGIVKEMQRDLRGACTDWQSALQLGANDVQAWINQQCR